MAAALLRPELLPEAGVSRGDFHDPKLGEVWSAIEGMAQRDEPVDAVTVATRSGHSDLVLTLAAEVPTGENIRFYGRTVREAAQARNIRVEVDPLVRGGDLSGPDLRSALQAVLDRYRGTSEVHGVDLATGLHRTLNEIESRYNAGGRPLGVTTGFAELDRLTSGLPRGVPFVLGGRPGDGKSALALSLALGACSYGHDVVFFSFEDTAGVLRERALAQRSGLNLMDVRRGALTARQWQTVAQAASELSSLPGKLVTVDGLPRDVSEVSRQAQAIAARHRFGLLVFDYFQLLRDKRCRSRSRSDELASCMGELTWLARKYRCAMIVCAQLRRDMEESAQPRLGHLKDSGQIEQDARAALLLQRRHGLCDDVGKPMDSIAVAWLEKNSNGPAPKRFPLHWEAASVRYGDASDEEERAWRFADNERNQKGRRR